MNGVCITRTKRTHVGNYAISATSVNIRIRLDDGPNFSQSATIFITHLSVTRGLTRTHLSCCSRTDSTVKWNEIPSYHVPNYSETWTRVSVLWYCIMNPMEWCGDIIVLYTPTFTVLRIDTMISFELNNNKHFQNVCPSVCIRWFNCTDASHRTFGRCCLGIFINLF